MKVNPNAHHLRFLCHRNVLLDETPSL